MTSIVISTIKSIHGPAVFDATEDQGIVIDSPAERIYAAIEQHPGIKYSALRIYVRDTWGIQQEEITRSLTWLQRRGRIEFKGPKNGGGWHPKEQSCGVVEAE